MIDFYYYDSDGSLVKQEPVYQKALQRPKMF